MYYFKTQENFNFINILKYITENVLCPDEKWTRRMLLMTAALNKHCH